MKETRLGEVGFIADVLQNCLETLLQVRSLKFLTRQVNQFIVAECSISSPSDGFLCRMLCIGASLSQLRRAVFQLEKPCAHTTPAEMHVPRRLL